MSVYAKEVNAERDMSKYIPYSNHISQDTLITKDGDYLRIWKVDGISFETSDPEDILLRKEQLNTLYRAISDNHIAIYTHDIRRQIKDRLESVFDNDFCRDYDKKYYDSFDTYKMMSNELYLTIIYRPAVTRVEKISSKANRKSLKNRQEDQEYALKQLDEIAYQIEASMTRYNLEPLTTYTEQVNGEEIIFSDALTFLNYLITGSWQKVRVPKAPIYSYLGDSWIFAGTETIEIRSPNRTRFAQGIDFKDYNSHTEPGILNGLLYLDFEFIITQSFCFMNKRDGLDFLKLQQRQLNNSADASVSQIQAMTDAQDQLQNGEFSMGEYHFSLLVFGDSITQVSRNRAEAIRIIQDIGFLANLINTATDAAFYAQLPANYAYRPRVARLTSKNFASLSPFHNFTAGKRDGNPWGQAVTLFKTPSGQPLYFNYHFSRDDDDAYDKKLLGNTRVIGMSGSGKTVLLNHLSAQEQKFKHKSKFTNIYLDKDRGADLFIRRIGGKYFTFENGKPTGLNPFQIENTKKNILFLQKLVKTIVTMDGNPITTLDEERINNAVNSVMHMPKELRRLSTVAQNMTQTTNQENSVLKRLSKWIGSGSFAWVFDNEKDKIDFTTHSDYGFDGTDFLDNDNVKTPISMYLLYRMDEVIDGRRFIFKMDEAWKWVDDPRTRGQNKPLSDDPFAEFAGNKQLTIRKQNGLGVYATQMPSSLLGSPIAASLVQQVATEIYLPNPKADYKEYTEGFKLTDSEFEIVKNLGEESRMFLIKQGHQSRIGWLNLKGFDDELAILSASTDDIAILDEILEEYNDEDLSPDIWVPIFYERRKQRVFKSKQGIMQ